MKSPPPNSLSHHVVRSSFYTARGVAALLLVRGTTPVSAQQSLKEPKKSSLHSTCWSNNTCFRTTESKRSSSLTALERCSILKTHTHTHAAAAAVHASTNTIEEGRPSQSQTQRATHLSPSIGITAPKREKLVHGDEGSVRRGGAKPLIVLPRFEQGGRGHRADRRQQGLVVVVSVETCGGWHSGSPPFFSVEH